MKKKVLINLLTIISIIFLLNEVELKAIDQYTYKVTFDYTCYYVYNTSEKIISSATDVSNITVPDSKGTPGQLLINLTGNEKTTKELLKNNDFINSTNINITISTIYSNCSISVVDGTGSLVNSSGTTSINLNDLKDDRYTVNIKCSGQGNNVSGRIYEMYYTNCTFTFTIDTISPTISGASLNMNGKYIKGNFNIIGNDEASGINRIYMKEAGSSTYELINSGATLSSSKNGLITFYAVDNAGNSSSLYYIYNDIEKPQGKIKDKNGNEILSTNITSDFFYEAIDNYSGINSMYIKKPNDRYYTLYNGEIIDRTYEEGEYMFMTLDKSGNQSDIKTIQYYKSKTEVQIIRVNNSNKVYLTWENDDYKVQINDKNYIKNDLISSEGTYTATIEDKYGNISNISFTISCYYILTKIIDPTCIEDGYSLYICISCGQQERKDYTSNGLHNYNSYYVEPTCTKSGGVYNYCIYCNLSYITDEVRPLLHDFSTSIKIYPTCTSDGTRYYECSRCGFNENKQISKTGHNYIDYEEVKKGKKITKTYKCTNCNNLINENIELKSNYLLSHISNIINNYFDYLVVILISISSIWSIYLGIKIIVCAKKEENIQIKKMIKNYIIGIILIFIILFAIPFVIKTMIDII